MKGAFLVQLSLRSLKTRLSRGTCTSPGERRGRENEILESGSKVLWNCAPCTNTGDDGLKKER